MNLNNSELESIVKLIHLRNLSLKLVAEMEQLQTIIENLNSTLNQFQENAEEASKLQQLQVEFQEIVNSRHLSSEFQEAVAKFNLN